VLQGFAGLSAAGMEPGYDKVNQDFICIQPVDSGDAPLEARGQSYMFAVLDGHGAEGVIFLCMFFQQI
jgi:serine/threonine protein phosphatase PrpC